MAVIYAGLALLHGSGLDDLLIVGVGLYLLVMLVLAGVKARKLRRNRPKKHPQQSSAEDFKK